MKKLLMGVLVMACVIFMGSKDASAWTTHDTLEIEAGESLTTRTRIGTDYKISVECTGGNIHGAGYAKTTNRKLKGTFLKKGQMDVFWFDEDDFGGYAKADPCDGAYAKLNGESWIRKYRDAGELNFYSR
ncbi:MAG TPA: hypothetical protein DEO82_05885 [Eubacterium sp.]|nr:hypothetical protein [Eubacterium sp.]